MVDRKDGQEGWDKSAERKTAAEDKESDQKEQILNVPSLPVHPSFAVSVSYRNVKALPIRMNVYIM